MVTHPLLFLRQTAFVVMILLVTVHLTACGSNEPIRIGFVAGTSGRVADLGISGRDGVQMAMEACNAAGGINGRPVELIIRDDRQNPETAREAVRELAAKGVTAIIGPMTSDMALAVLPLLDEIRIPAVSPTVSSRKLSGRDDYFFRVTATTDDNARQNAAFHLREKSMSRVVAVYDLNNLAFCENWLKNFREQFESGGGRVISQIGFDTGQGNSFMTLAQKVVSESPDGLLIIANSMDAALLCQQVRKLNTVLAITIADWGATERLLELGGRAVEGVTVIQAFDRDHQGSRYKAFRTAYTQRFGRDPGFPGVRGYDAAQVVLTALKDWDGKGNLKSALQAIGRIPGLQEDIVFDRYGDVVRSGVTISIVKHNRFVIIE